MNRLNSIIYANARMAEATWNTDMTRSRYYCDRAYKLSRIAAAIRRPSNMNKNDHKKGEKNEIQKKAD